MFDIIQMIKEIIEKGSKQEIIDSYTLDNGIYIKADKNKLTPEDIYEVNSKLDIASSIEEYHWFRLRAFFEGMLNSDSNKAILQRGVLSKKIHSITPYALMFKAENIDKFVSQELIEEHFTLVGEINQMDFDTREMAQFFYTKIMELKELISLDNSLIPNKGRILIFKDEEPLLYEKAYENYMKIYGFGKSSPPIEKDGTLYGRPCIGLNLDSGKLINITCDLRKIPYLISSEDNLILSYISKLRRNIEDVVNKKSEDMYTIDINISDISRLDKKQVLERKKIYRKFSPIKNNARDAVESEKCHGEILEIIDKDLMDWTITPAITKNILTSADVSDYYKINTKKISNMQILNQIIADRDCFKHYFNGSNDIDISKSLEKIFKLTYEHHANQINKGFKDDKEEIAFYIMLRSKIDTMLSVLDYTSGKEIYRSMATIIYDLFNKFSKQKEEGEVVVSNDAEFFFMSGQLIRYLASLSESKDKKANLMGNFMLKKRDRIKDMIIDMYDLYSHKLPLYSESYVNLMYQQIVSYGIGEKEVSCKDNWYYYQAGLVGKNLLFNKNKSKKTEDDSTENTELE